MEQVTNASSLPRLFSFSEQHTIAGDFAGCSINTHPGAAGADAATSQLDADLYVPAALDRARQPQVNHRGPTCLRLSCQAAAERFALASTTGDLGCPDACALDGRGKSV